MLPYELTAFAEEDLKEIARYTLVTWGKNQALQYADALEKRFNEIAVKTAHSKTFSNRYPNVRVTRCEHHYIFYLHPEGAKPCIIAILHERMSMLAWLENRLNLD